MARLLGKGVGDRQTYLLAVDDEPAIRDLYVELLTLENYRVDVAENGIGALDLMARNSYDAVLLDLRMPKKAGMDVLRLVRQTLPELPVIVVSGVAHPSEFQAARAAGAFACIRKPFRFDELFEAIDSALRPDRRLSA